jgi:hypothetical protein
VHFVQPLERRQNLSAIDARCVPFNRGIAHNFHIAQTLGLCFYRSSWALAAFLGRNRKSKRQKKDTCVAKGGEVSYRFHDSTTHLALTAQTRSLPIGKAGKTTNSSPILSFASLLSSLLIN